MAIPAPVVDDLSAFVISGRVKSRVPDDSKYETTVRTPAQGVQDGVDAEQLGFARVFVAERLELKEAGVMLGGIAARTSRIGVGSGIIGVGTRHPMLAASLGATMQAAYGPRFTMGIGKGAQAFTYAPDRSYDAIGDYCTILKRIWAGEQFDYSGPAGRYDSLGLKDRYDGEPPKIYYGGFGLPRSATMIAETPAIDGVILPAPLTPLGVSRAIENIRSACERADRDPASVAFLAEVLTAPELSEEETRQLIHARTVTYLQPQSWSRPYWILNDWDPAVGQRLREHPQLASRDRMADEFHRVQLVEASHLLPEQWMTDVAAMGSLDDCVRKLQEFRDAGANEICTYASTPRQNAGLIAAWRDHKARADGVAVGVRPGADAR